MAIGGSNVANFDVDLINLDDNPNAVCPDVANYPVAYGSVGTFIQDRVLVCGGYDINNETTSDCFTYNNEVNLRNS